MVKRLSSLNRIILIITMFSITLSPVLVVGTSAQRVEPRTGTERIDLSASTVIDERLTLTTYENMTMLNDGRFLITLLTIVTSPTLADTYRKSLSISRNVDQNGEIEIREKTTEVIDVGDDSANAVAPDGGNYREGIEEEQMFFLGTTPEIVDCKMIPKDTDGNLRIMTSAYASLRILNSTETGPNTIWEIGMGPMNEDITHAFVRFIFSKITFIQMMLRSIEGRQIYDYSWSTKINLPSEGTLLNRDELDGLNWVMDFGGGTSMFASVSVDENSNVFLDERSIVTETEINSTPENLLRDIPYYKSFNLGYVLPKSAALNSGSQTKKDDWSYTWSYPLWSQSIELSFSEGPLSASLKVTPSLTIQGYVGWDADLGGLAWFEAWMSATTSVKVEFEASATVGYSHTWETTLFEWKSTYSFWVGPVPVWADLQFTSTASLTVSAHATLSLYAQAEAQAIFKAGVSWTRESGWSGISDVTTSSSKIGPAISVEAGASIRPAVQFQLAFLFYGLAGPFIECESYVNAAISYVFPNGSWELSVGFDIIAGATFVGWLKDLLGLDDWSTVIYEKQLASWSGTWGPSSISITETISPSTVLTNGAVQVYGTVTFSDGSPVSLTDLIITITQTGACWTLTTDDNGYYSGYILAPSSGGTYSIRIDAASGSTGGSNSQQLIVQSPSGGGTYSFYRSTTCKGVQASSPYDPIDETNVFRASDPTEYTWVELTNVYRSLNVKFEWYKPDGGFYSSYTVSIPDPKSQGYSHWSWYRCWGYIYISGYSAQDIEGRWSSKAYVDEGSGYQLKAIEEFVIRYEVRRRTMAKDVQTSAPYEPVNPTNLFLNTDPMALGWIGLDDVAEQLEVKWEWYDNSSTLYNTFYYTVSDPSSQGYSYWDWYVFWGYINIVGNQPQSKLGQWTVKSYIKDVTGNWDLEYSECFTISDNTPPGAPGTPADGGLYSSSGNVTWTWTEAAEDGTVVQYQIQIGTTPGGSDVFDRCVGTALSENRSNLLSGFTYYARVRAMNQVGQWGPWSGVSDGITIDRPPMTMMTNSPVTAIEYGDVNFNWTGSDDLTSVSGLVYSYCLIGYDTSWSAFASETSRQYVNLTSGTYTFRVRAKDASENVDPSPAEVSFTINPRSWSYNCRDLARTLYYASATTYRIPDQPFETLWSSPHEGKNLMALTGDVNDDGKLEVVKVSGDNLKLISGNGTGLWTRTIPGVDSYYGTGYLYLNLLEDVNGDGVQEIFVSRKTADTVGDVYVYDGQGNLLKTITRSLGSDGNMWAVAAFDVDNNGHKEILCGIASNYVGNPRGVCLFDYDTGSELWYYAAGNSIADCVADLNNDGKMEITSSWWTVHNGASGSGKGSNTYTSDSSVYVVVINQNGDEVFTWQIHDTHNEGGSFERITDLNKDGIKELLVFHGHEGAYPGDSQIFMLSPAGTVLETFTGSYNANWYLPTIADVNHDGNDEIIVGCNDGVLRVLDCNLTVIASSNHRNVPQAATDLNGDGQLEIVVSDYDTRELVVLDDNLNQLWKLSFPVAPTAIVSDVNDDGVNDLIITADQLYVATNPTTAKEPTPIFDSGVSKISLRYEINPVDTTFNLGARANVSIYDLSNRGTSTLIDLGPRAEDVYLGSFTFDVFKNRDDDPQITREEVVQNFYETVPPSVLQELATYISKTHVLYSDLSTVDFLFANFALEILEGTQPQATQAFSVLTFILPVPLVEPTYICSLYGYKLSGAWNSLGGGFGTGSLKTVSVYCYADLRVIDSLGRITNKTMNEIPGAYYFEADLNNDGELDDTVVLPGVPGLTYTIWVVAESDAPLNSTYTLVLGSADVGIPLAENVALSDAPVNGYQLASLASPQEIPPTTNLTIGNPQRLTASGDLFINSSTPLRLEALVQSGQVESAAYRIQNSTYSCSFSCTPPETFYLTGLSDGTYYIDYYSIDSDGNVEAAKNVTVIVDNTAPSTSLAIGEPKHGDTETTFVTVDTNFTISADDDLGSGVVSTFCRISNTTYDGGWLLYASPFNLAGLSDGNYTISYCSIDNVGNAKTSNSTVTLVRLLGDLNSDFEVDIYDAIILANAYNSTPSSSNWNPKADINSDGSVDIFDAIILAGHYNQHFP